MEIIHLSKEAIINNVTTSVKISKMSPDSKKTQEERKALSQLSTNFCKAMVCLHDWAYFQNITLLANKFGATRLKTVIHFTLCVMINYTLISMYSAIHI